MAGKCIDTQLGDLIHAYELGILPEDEQIKFEEHLLDCSYCAAKFEKMASVSKLLRTRDMLSAYPDENGMAAARVQKSWWVRIKASLWPDVPYGVRPGLLLVLIALLVYPSYLGITSLQDERIRSVQSVSLIPSRAGQFESIVRMPKADIVLNFVYEGAEPGRYYSIAILDDAGGCVYEQEEYSGFNEFGMGQLLIPSGQLEDGRYRLLISDPTMESSGTQEYRFLLRSE